MRGFITHLKGNQKQMAEKQKNILKIPYIFGIILCSVFSVGYNISDANAATVTSRSTATTASRPTTTRTNAVAARMPSATVSGTVTETAEEETTEEATETAPEIVVENKASQFDTIVSANSTSGTDTSAANLAEMVRQQRAALDAQDAITTATNTAKNATGNACDTGLRKCMQESCGEDFTDCRGDTDTEWGRKMESCRLRLECSGDEYTLFAAEIKADRDINAQLMLYNNIIDCGNKYNDCIITECGTTFSKCLGKTAGDAAIAKCRTIADECKEQDGGLANRAMQVFAELRQDAEIQVQKDEERLYELRDLMSQQCKMLGATFDERTFSCVYTVEFWAGDNATLFASKKAYAGDVFSCTPNWFGIDVTTFMENAYRATREQSSATAGFMGSGVGVAAGAITSGAISRAIDTQKAKKALKDAEKEHEETYGDDADKNASDKDAKNDTGNDGDKADKGDKGAETETANNETLTTTIPFKDSCELGGNIWINGKCVCKNGGTFNTITGLCECSSNQELKDGMCTFKLDIDLSTPNTGSSINLLNPTRSVISR